MNIYIKTFFLFFLLAAPLAGYSQEKVEESTGAGEADEKKK